jgi:hypothetical protein
MQKHVGMTKTHVVIDGIGLMPVHVWSLLIMVPIIDAYLWNTLGLAKGLLMRLSVAWQMLAFNVPVGS